MAKPLKNQHEQNMFEDPKQLQAQIIRGLRYFIVLQLLNIQPLHGYRIITVIRKKFGIYLGPSSIYPLLKDLESWEYVESIWETKDFHPKRVYRLTTQGQNLLNYMEHSVGHILIGMGIAGTTQPLEEE
ncbi:PadR family transcriptional regulator [bacterium]|nr:MAG: PadR family transcriptional regulator [bacterium]